jgi:Mg2+ and Co2+ transporter CorA
VEEYDTYLFTIIDGVRYEKQKASSCGKGEVQNEDGSSGLNRPSDNESDTDLEEDDLNVFLEQRCIITINFNNQQLASTIKQRISKSLMPSYNRSVPVPSSERHQQQALSSKRNVDSSNYNRAICGKWCTTLQ